MTQEEKYKKALERASKLRVQNPFDTVGQMVEHIFPELAESDDEKIRKEIVDFITSSNKYGTNERCEAWLNWLEKQGEQNSPIDANKMVDEFANTEVKGYGIPSMIEVDAYRKGIEDALEKQGEGKSTIFIPKFRLGDNLVSTKNPRLTYEVLEVGHINELGNPEYKVEIFTDGKAENPHNIHYMECCKVDEWAKLIEHKPADKVEPKFKVGYWITTGQYSIAWRVVNNLYGIYELISSHGYKVYESIPIADNLWRLWSITDAKNGDIVYFECHGNKHLFIVKSVGETKDHVEGHFWYDITRNECEVWDGRLPYSNIASMCDAIPATKEQCDLLFQKMHEVGYKWDQEEKKLIKMKEAKFKVGDWI